MRGRSRRSGRTDRTDASGEWEIEGAFIAGLYYARVANALVHVNGESIRCSFDLTLTMRYLES